MMCLSILQPYAWLIVNGFKDIENRTWRTERRGTFLVHAGKKYGLKAHREYAAWLELDHDIQLPTFEEMMKLTGGIVGQADICGCVRDHCSRWKDEGSWGFVLDRQRPLPFMPLRGQLGFFQVSYDAEANKAVA